MLIVILQVCTPRLLEREAKNGDTNVASTLHYCFGWDPAPTLTGGCPLVASWQWEKRPISRGGQANRWALLVAEFAFTLFSHSTRLAADFDFWFISRVSLAGPGWSLLGHPHPAPPAALRSLSLSLSLDFPPFQSQSITTIMAVISLCREGRSFSPLLSFFCSCSSNFPSPTLSLHSLSSFVSPCLNIARFV